MTYQMLDQISDGVASTLLHQQIRIESLVAVLMERSIDAVASQLGILKAGGAYLPLAPCDFPLERIHTIFADAQVDYVVSQKKHQPLIAQLEKKLGRQLACIYIDEQLEIAANNEKNTLLDQVQVEPDNLAYVMYTSGSTGKPKGVMITHRNIVSVVKDTNYVDFCQTDAVLHAAPISFDAATFEIWGALLNGLDLHVIPEQIVHDFDALTDYVRNRPISIAWLTSALFNLLTDTRPDFFEFLRQLMVGGEALSARHINRIRARYPHLKIRNNYGPTENTVFSTSFLIEKSYDDTIPIGSPITGRRAYILDEHLNVVRQQATGLLYVAGEGLARGYLNLPLETLGKFVPDPFFKGERMYATGDLCRYNVDGDIEFIGRLDDQVKVSGHRIELGEIEAVLRACSSATPAIKQAVVLYKELGANIKGLAAYIDHGDRDGERDDIRLEQNLAQIKENISATLPPYMIPGYFETVDRFPINTNGKIDRKAMQSWPLKSRYDPDSHDRNTRETVLAACRWALNLEKIDSAQSFFDLGGDSLSGTSLIVELEQLLEVSLPLSVLYETPVIDDFVHRIETCSESSGQTFTNESRPHSLARDARLDFDIALNGRTVHTPDSDRFPVTIFLTGCTGFFGAFLLKELLSTTAATIHCLVRADNESHALTRICDTFKKYKIPLSIAEQTRLVGIPGDLTKANLGMSETKFATLSNTIDLIFHNGAVVNYVDSYSTLKQPNVFGTQEVIRLSCLQRIIPVHYVSSISVFETLGFFTGREMIHETDSVDSSERYVKLGYSQSKWVAEKMMENARDKGLPINIYRSGYIMGHSETGVSNTTDHIARYIAGCIEMGSAPILSEYASLAPVDQLSQAFAHIALNSVNQGNTYHLCNPVFVTVGDIYQKIQDFGFPLELISYAEWKQRLKTIPDTNPLYPLLSLHIHAAPDHQLTLPELYEHNSRFDCSQLISALAGSGIDISLDDSAIFERWLHNYVEAGLISSETFKTIESDIF